MRDREMDRSSPCLDSSDKSVHKRMEKNDKGGNFVPNLQEQYSVEECSFLGSWWHYGLIFEMVFFP